jgi:hypothetical protein
VTATHNVTAPAVALLVNSIERLPPEMSLAGDTGETIHMKHLLHGDTVAAIVKDFVAATCTATWKYGGKGEKRGDKWEGNIVEFNGVSQGEIMM